MFVSVLICFNVRVADQLDRTQSRDSGVPLMTSGQTTRIEFRDRACNRTWRETIGLFYAAPGAVQGSTA